MKITITTDAGTLIETIEGVQLDDYSDMLRWSTLARSISAAIIKGDVQERDEVNAKIYFVAPNHNQTKMRLIIKVPMDALLYGELAIVALGIYNPEGSSYYEMIFNKTPWYDNIKPKLEAAGYKRLEVEPMIRV